MEVGMAVRALVRIPLSARLQEDAFLRGSPLPTRSRSSSSSSSRNGGEKPGRALVVEAKGKKGMMGRQFQRPPPPPLPKIEDDGNPKFVIFIRSSNDEKDIQKTAFKQFRVLRTAPSFRYGYKLVVNGNVRAALSTSDVIELPPQEELKTVIDKVKDFFGEATSGAKESFGKLTSLSAVSSSEPESESQVES
ncbi:protein HHL1, chloroplastic isoform X2 [Dioscorea cayenensis subsp. rotundata]|uniref:Protein HHL1, chloroplastic isoform X2 n=1 Tax=Dioscorea cayennensis subsp. rotundata TaxID=55577 RepID=A0AB40ARF9_DIOCR|nr:protein HHL1, chloroplastic isoform X2 [Dioscorea cayenensis subsp. rotundata]